MCDALDSLESNQQPQFLASGTGWISESLTRILIFKKKQVWQNAYMFWTLTASQSKESMIFQARDCLLHLPHINISYNMHFSVCYIEYLLIPFPIRGITLHHTNIILGEDLEATFEFTHWKFWYHLGSCGSVTKSCTPTLRGQGDPKVPQPFSLRLCFRGILGMWLLVASSGRK